MRSILLPILPLAILAGCTANLSGNLMPSGTNVTKTVAANGEAKTPTKIQFGTDTLVITTGMKKPAGAVVSYSDGTKDSNAIYTSSDDTVVSINGTTGEISGVKPGVATVVAASANDPTVKTLITVTVKQGETVPALVTVEPASLTLSVGATGRVNPVVKLSDGTTSPNVVWTSDNTSIAMVSNGLVTAIAPGTTTITVSAQEDSSKRATVQVTVTGSTPAPTPTPTAAAQ